MNTQKVVIGLVYLVAMLVLMVGLSQAQAPDPQSSITPQTSLTTNASTQPAVISTGFTYQGQLKKDGQPISGACGMAFRLYADASAGNPVGSPITRTVTISSGLFTEALDFGASAFDGNPRWLAIAVKCASDAAYAPLSRQAITAAPYAHYAVSSGALHNYPVTTTAPALNQVLKWNGSVWSPAADEVSAAGSGDITAVYPGSGLGGGGETGAVTLTVSFGGNGSAATVARSDHNHNGVYALFAHTHLGTDITSAVAQANNADLLDGQHASAFQNRVSGMCAVGSTIRAVNADGTVVCQVDAPLNRPTPPLTNTRITLDSAGDVGQYAAVTIGVDGLGLICYYDYTNDNLKVAHCSDTACTAATFTTLDSTGTVGQYAAVTIGADGLGLISYYDYTNGDLKVAHCSNTLCSAATLTTLDSTGDVGGYDTSVTIGADGLGLISYYDYTNYDLKVAHCSNTACTAATLTTLDSTGDVGRYASLAIGADGLGLISYYDGDNSDLKVAHCSNTLCSAATLTTLDSAGNVGYDPAVTIGVDGLGLISYYDDTNDDLKAAHCSNTACTAATLTPLDNAGVVGDYSSVTIGADGLGLISYWDGTPNNDLKVAHCSNTVCTAATFTTLDSAASVGSYDTSVTIGADGLGLISYYDGANGDLKVVHCSNAFCMPYFRRR